MKALKLLDVFPVLRPCFTAKEETGENNCLVHFDLGGQLDVLIVHYTSAKATQGLTGFADASCDFLSSVSSETMLSRHLS